MNGTSLIGYIINTGTSTVHERYMIGYMNGTWLGTSLKILKYNNTLILKYWILLKIKNFEFLANLSISNYQKSKTVPGYKTLLPAKSLGTVFYQKCMIYKNQKKGKPGYSLIFKNCARFFSRIIIIRAKVMNRLLTNKD
ncbi:MAG: hypothetical protein FD155_447 [Bacteroidetes bacterium]|nr:MAG: hypothetical protein FD155_447 [Bacteroidota bacterium]